MLKPQNKNLKYKVNKGFVIQKMQAETIIFDGDDSMLYTLNETASYIFSKLKSGWEIKKIAFQLVKKYKIKFGKAIVDIEELIGRLRQLKILK